MKTNFKFLFSFVAIAFFFTACNHTPQIVPYDVDIDEIYKPLLPNEDDLPNDTTYGIEKVPGTTLEIDLKTSHDEVYVFFENFTVLQINSSITQNLFEFVQEQLCEYGFVNQSFSLPQNTILNYITQGNSYKEAALKVIDKDRSAFEAQLDTIASYNTPFNISIQIYPVYLDSKYVTYRLYSYAYTGGAHGNTVSYLRTFDLLNGKLLTLNDIIKSEDIQEVREDVIAQMAYSYPIYENITTVPQYLDSLNIFLGDFHGEAEPGDSGIITQDNYPLPDPAITEEGLVFVYQMYELTPGSDGCPVVLIPYKDISGCLKIKDFS